MKLPVISGEQAVAAFQKLGYQIDHQRGSHVILRRPNPPLPQAYGSLASRAGQRHPPHSHPRSRTHCRGVAEPALKTTLESNTQAGAEHYRLPLPSPLAVSGVASTITPMAVSSGGAAFRPRGSGNSSRSNAGTHPSARASPRFLLCWYPLRCDAGPRRRHRMRRTTSRLGSAQLPRGIPRRRRKYPRARNGNGDRSPRAQDFPDCPRRSACPEPPLREPGGRPAPCGRTPNR